MLTDDTLREGMQAPGISFSVEEKKQMAKKIANCDIEKILISYPPAHRSEWEIARYISSENIFREVYGLGRSIIKDIDNIHSAGCHLSLHFPILWIRFWKHIQHIHNRQNREKMGNYFVCNTGRSIWNLFCCDTWV